MTTTFYVSWMTRATNRSNRWYVSKEFPTEAEARSIYEAKMAQANVREAYLFRKDHSEPEELVPEVRARQPWGADSFTQLSTYGRF